MTERERPLPTPPPRSRFGREDRDGAGPEAPLTADRMTQAAAHGRLEEFLQGELPEGEHARKLAMMMLGMTGMVPTTDGAHPEGPQDGPAPTAPTGPADKPAPPHVSPEIVAAAQQGDVGHLARMLKAEHESRSPTEAGPGPAQQTPSTPAAAPAPAGKPAIDSAIVDELVRIATDSGVSVDWLVLRAVRLYVEEHRRTGRL